MKNKIVLIILYSYIIINIKNVIYIDKNELSCRRIIYSNISIDVTNTIKNVYFSYESKKKYVKVIKTNEIVTHYITNIDYDNYSLLLVKEMFITARVIIHKCKIVLFSGQCKDQKWYFNQIKNKEKIQIINKCISIINWHGDAVFHGTIEGLTRITPYIDFLLQNKHIFIFIPYPRYIQNTAEKILNILGFSRKRILYGKYFVKNLYIPIPYYCGETSTPLLYMFNKILREKMINKKCLVKEKEYILIIQRSNNRIIDNIDIIKNELIHHFNYSIIIYHDTNDNLDEVYCWFTYAKIIIAYHGSGLTNIYFSKQSTTVIEIAPQYAIYAFAKIGCQLGLNYYIYRLNYSELYRKNIHLNASSFINTLKFYNIIR